MAKENTLKRSHLAALIRRSATEVKSRIAAITPITKPDVLRLFIASLTGLHISLRRFAMRRHAGFTLIELVLALAILGILGSMAVSHYKGKMDTMKISHAKDDIKLIEVLIELFYTDHRYYPSSLSEVALGTMLDPWGNPYQYLVIPKGKEKGLSAVRKDKSLHPINSDYDLYSMGENGQSVAALTAKASHDDIIRARNGQFVGLASDF